MKEAIILKFSLLVMVMFPLQLKADTYYLNKDMPGVNLDAAIAMCGIREAVVLKDENILSALFSTNYKSVKLNADETKEEGNQRIRTRTYLTSQEIEKGIILREQIVVIEIKNKDRNVDKLLVKTKQLNLKDRVDISELSDCNDLTYLGFIKGNPNAQSLDESEIGSAR